ncbi:cadherin-related family member 5 [Centroberyx affinis]|uniref:cadherin-related family member 5 n=1 Tax=Centroberyx affinis TaxID=166261 RepID=UPI003A5C5FFB
MGEGRAGGGGGGQAKMLSAWKLLFWQLAVKLSYHIVTASLCLGGSDIFATVRENSPTGQFIANLSITGDPGANTIRLCLTGENADWFYLEGRTIRLNSSSSRALDREVQGAILMAELTCYEDDIIQSKYRIMVEILNENDNKPRFLEETIQPFYINELAAVNSVVFTVKAIDADGDIISYTINKSSPNASYFRIDLPNSGNVVLDKPLDYETKTQLQLVIYATEANTREKYNTSATLTVHIKDGDDQYPHFLPCTPASPDEILPVCTNPVYTTNITEKDQDMILDFFPGPIHAVDGDRSLDTPLNYTILSGADHGRFVIDNQAGEITLTRPVENRQLTPTFRLHIMASQLNDPMKYSVTTALVRVLAENSFPPFFNRTIYKGFVIQSSSPATIISTYGNQVLLIQAIDTDFRDEVNPNIHYSLHPLSASEGLYRITQEGVLIARTDRLRAFDRHILEVVARDEESGEVATASVDIEVLQRGQPVPRGPFTEEQLFGDMDTRLAGGIAAMVLLLFVAALFLLLRIVRRRRSSRDPADQGAIALGKHPNVVNSSQPEYLMEEMSYNNEAFTGEYEPPRSGSLHGRQGVYTRKQSLPPSFPNSEQESSSGPLSDLLRVPAKSAPQPRDFTPSLQYKGQMPVAASSTGAAVKDKMLESVKEETQIGTECFPTVKEGLHSVLGRTEVLSTDVGAMVQGDGKGRLNIVKFQGMKGNQKREAKDTKRDVENPYSSMHAVICVSDDDTSSED